MNIAEQRELATSIMAGVEREGAAERLAELVLALDEWRRKGGFDPYPNESF